MPEENFCNNGCVFPGTVLDGAYCQGCPDSNTKKPDEIEYGKRIQ